MDRMAFSLSRTAWRKKQKTPGFAAQWVRLEMIKSELRVGGPSRFSAFNFKTQRTQRGEAATPLPLHSVLKRRGRRGSRRGRRETFLLECFMILSPKPGQNHERTESLRQNGSRAGNFVAAGEPFRLLQRQRKGHPHRELIKPDRELIKPDTPAWPLTRALSHFLTFSLSHPRSAG
jgi:hypothetical protein